MRSFGAMFFPLSLAPAVCLAQNDPPVAVASADRTEIAAGEQVCFDGSQSHDPENGPLAYRWTLPHEQLSAEVAFCHTFDTVGSFTVTLRVTDDAGGWDLDFLSITVGLPSGACCLGTLCLQSSSDACTGSFQGQGTTCGTLDNPTTCCPANFNQTGGLTVQDIFDFLAAYFGGDPAADFNGLAGLSVQDIFDYLAAYFTGCP
jgi:hypothetical protein